MTVATYENLALGWKPERSSDHRFNLIAIVVLVVMLLVGIVLSSIDVPKEERQARAVPERIAQFVMQREKPKPPIKVVEPKPKPKPKLKVKKLPRKKAVVKKPLTKVQKKARQKAETSGLLALNDELAGLMDSSSVAAVVSTKIVSPGKITAQKTAVNKQLLASNVSKGSGGVSTQGLSKQIDKTSLQQRQATRLDKTLVADKSKSKTTTNKKRTAGVRMEEDVTVVFDKNKSKLYSIYNKARRKNPGLKGKIVLEITIQPSGRVSNIKMLSSELNDKKLERRLMGRIKLFNFGARDVEAITVTYPIEFLPS
ncbi:MAG: TonB family protein [Gammaproteobacteria bacterium]|nr:TonB family protein [Gammaproteobacteria bacterium]